MYVFFFLFLFFFFPIHPLWGAGLKKVYRPHIIFKIPGTFDVRRSFSESSAASTDSKWSQDFKTDPSHDSDGTQV